MTLNKIDYVLISSNKKELNEDVRSMRGPNTDSHHYLLKIIVNQKLPKIYLKKNRDCTRIWNKANLKNPIKLQEYRRTLHKTAEANTSRCGARMGAYQNGGK
jgi:hypothetical protein